MKQSFFEITQNIPLTKNVYRMKLRGDTSEVTAAGQFINIKLDGFYLRRPISVCDCDADVITIIYKVVGKGTEKMSRMQGGKLDVLTGLGNGYDTSVSGSTPLLLGGGAAAGQHRGHRAKHLRGHLAPSRATCGGGHRRPWRRVETFPCEIGCACREARAGDAAAQGVREAPP